MAFLEAGEAFTDVGTDDIYDLSWGKQVYFDLLTEFKCTDVFQAVFVQVANWGCS
jgi:hypothetical protein